MYFRRHDKTTDYCVYGGSRLKTLIHLDLYQCREYVCDSSNTDLWTFRPYFVGNFLALDMRFRQWASQPIATCKGCQDRHANNNITIPSAILSFLNAYNSGTEEDRTRHHLPTSEIHVEVMP